MIEFKNNFERDVWYSWFERSYIDPQTGLPQSGKSPADAAKEADQVLEKLQERDKRKVD